MDIFGALKDLGHDTGLKTFYDKVAEWDGWYRGKVEKFHSYKVWNGQKNVQCERFSMGMAKKVAEDWANLLLNEKVKLTLNGEAEQKFIDEVLESNKFSTKGNEMQEYKAALGTAAYIPRAVGIIADAESGELAGSASGIKIDYVTAESIFPLTWENGYILECAFAADKTVGETNYVFLQRHIIGKDGNYEIHNHLYQKHKDTAQLTEIANPASVAGFENIKPVIYTGSPHRQFAIDRPNLANNVDRSCPMGISVYANATDQLKGVDVAYDSYVNEFILGKKRIMVKPEATKNFEDGSPLFDTNELAFYMLPEGAGNDSVIKEIDMKLRTEEHNTGMQDMLNSLSAKCGFGENHYRYNNGSVSTATQIISENSSLFRTLRKHEIILEDALTELCRILLRMGNAYMSAGLKEDVEISIAFDDSIIIHTEEEREQDRRDVAMGVMPRWEYRSKWYGEDKATAKAALPDMESLVSE